MSRAEPGRKIWLFKRVNWLSNPKARQARFGDIEGYYNRHHMYSALGYLTPEQAEKSMNG